MNIYVWIILLLPFAGVFIYAIIFLRAQPQVEPQEEEEYHDAVDDDDVVNETVCDICEGNLRSHWKCKKVLRNLDVLDTTERPFKLPLALLDREFRYFDNYLSERYPDDNIEKETEIDIDGLSYVSDVIHHLIFRKRESFIKSAKKT